MMKFDWQRHRDLPTHKTETRSAISKIIGDRRYVEWCAAATEVQNYWRTPEYIVWFGNVAILTSNINAGDFFNHGAGSTQIGIVTAKITLTGKPGWVDGLRDSIHPH